jgi:alkylation response protein AidB-like acyl-CoA dehydrogenase
VGARSHSGQLSGNHAAPEQDLREIRAGTKAVRETNRTFSGRRAPRGKHEGAPRSGAKSGLSRRVDQATGKSAVLEAAVAKLFVSESFVQSCLDAIQIHGGYGYMTNFGVERDLRDSIFGTIYSGTSEIQRNIIAAMLELAKVE